MSKKDKKHLKLVKDSKKKTRKNVSIGGSEGGVDLPGVRDLEVSADFIKSKDMTYWLEQLRYYDPEKEDEEKTERIARRVLNLADLTAFVDNFVKVNSQEIYHLVQKQSQDLGVIREILIHELGVSVEKIEQYEDVYQKKLEKEFKVIEKIQAMGEAGEDLTMEDIERIYQEVLQGEETDEE